MRNRFDELGKQIGKAALGPFGATVPQHGISPETQYADLRHEPDPAHAAERELLGLLGRIASSPCLIELYAHAPTDAEFRACLGKHIAYWHAREARTQGTPPPVAGGAPFLWIIAAGTPTSLVADLALVQAPGWPTGVYVLGPNVLRVGLVAANRLPLDRSTLLVRLMAAGPLLRPAIVELSALPADAHERIVADRILLRFQHVLGLKPERTDEEEEFLVTMYSTWEDARELGQRQGRAEARADDLLTVLRVRGIPVSEAERERILAERDLERLARWLERAVVATSLAAVLDEPT
ncbi:MAG TPA: hypothetical protein VK932_00325 [Kofleriaceae bacterium]|nr:hypothetical protein [Kofleriaceae bacterium]